MIQSIRKSATPLRPSKSSPNIHMACVKTKTSRVQITNRGFCVELESQGIGLESPHSRPRFKELGDLYGLPSTKRTRRVKLSDIIPNLSLILDLESYLLILFCG